MVIPAGSTGLLSDSDAQRLMLFLRYHIGDLSLRYGFDFFVFFSTIWLDFAFWPFHRLLRTGA